MKSAVIAVSLFFAAVGAYAQGKLNFTSESHAFGEVIEGRVASHEFKFVNTGTQPIIISNVQASCGCTTPFWTKDPILPGKEGSIKASYNSAGRPGPFNKSITVTSNAAEGTKILSFNGSVIGKDKMPTVSDEMKANAAKLVFDKTEINLGKLEQGQNGVARFTFTNKGKSDLEIYDAASSTYVTSWRVDKPSVKPGEKGTLEITYNARGKVGANTEVITVTSTDYNDYFQKLNIKAVIGQPSGSVMKAGANAAPFK